MNLFSRIFGKTKKSAAAQNKGSRIFDIKGGKMEKSCEDESTTYLTCPDGLRLVFADNKYIGWYVCDAVGWYRQENTEEIIDDG